MKKNSQKSQPIKPDPASDICYGKTANPPKNNDLKKVSAEELAEALKKANSEQKKEDGKRPG